MTGLRITTFNLLHGLDVRSRQVDLDAAAAAVDKLDADVVAVQEVDRGLSRSGELDQVAELAARLDRTGVFAPALLGDPTLRWIRGPGAAAPCTRTSGCCRSTSSPRPTRSTATRSS